MSVQIDVSQGKHGDYLLIRASADTVTLDWIRPINRYEATISDNGKAKAKEMVDADPRLGDRKPGVIVTDSAGSESMIYPLDYQQWRDIRGLTHSDP